ncbi:MAG: acetyl-CoA carboxylase carboxyltransferase subunit alpha [Candidatus Paracaedibacteraceae bacterium]|nr:acetyl-CoA carboxylase carboxyltransferase subunit alpha [Candidatus Paracaedibacteraceae bacterium]
MIKFLDFEKPIADLEGKIEELRHISGRDLNIADEVARLQNKADRLLKQTYQNLTPWQKVQVARHPDRPKFFDYLDVLIDNFMPLSGDRLFGEDCSIVGGFGHLLGRSVMVIGQQKGHDTESRIKHNFGMPKPEGYRKAQRLMLLANRFNLPVITFVDTAGAFPGIEAEERGQAEAIAKCIEVCLDIKVPLLSVVIGEGGSGGAIAIAAANTILMLEHAVYSVISPEGCASILWRSSTKAPEAAEAQKLTAQDLIQLGVIDKIIPEPTGGAHRNKTAMIRQVKEAIEGALIPLIALDGNQLLNARRDKFINMGQKGL